MRGINVRKLSDQQLEVMRQVVQVEINRRFQEFKALEEVRAVCRDMGVTAQDIQQYLKAQEAKTEARRKAHVAKQLNKALEGV